MAPPASTAPPHASFAAIAFIAVMALGLWQVAATLRDPAMREIPATAQDIREGRTAVKVEREIEKRLPWRDELVAVACTMRYLLGHGGGPDVVVGREGWLFLADELRYHAEADREARIKLDALGEANRALAKRGITLVVALVPDKARVNAGHLPQRAIPRYNAARYANAVEGLRARSVPVVDLIGPLGGPSTYYRTDTHWNQKGARIAAQAIAAAAQANGIARGGSRFRESAGAEIERPGDLIHLMGLDHAPRVLQPPADREAPVAIEEVADANAGGGLFGEASIEAVLLGTSYSRRASFHGFLQEALGMRVLDASRDGAGFAQSAATYFANAAFRESPPRVIVWEIPERVLPEKDEAAGALAKLLQ
jgi:alginate O-acetyltransferase complex protein AlgJ